MDHEREDLLRRIEALEQRVRDLESAPAAPVRPAPPSRPAPAQPPRPLPSPARSAPARRAPVRTAREPITRERLERLLGGNLFLVLGALIVVVGIGLFLKLAWDQGWLQRVTPVWRCVGAGFFGAMLLLIGEFGSKKLGRFAMVGFSAAGLGVLFSTAYATYAVFLLVPPSAGVWMIIGVGALGIALGVRARTLWLSALGLIGGYLAPVVIHPPDPPAWGLPAHVTGLFFVACILSVKAARQRMLSTIAWWCTGLLGTVWLAVDGSSVPWLALAFIGVIWSLAHWAIYRRRGKRRLTPFRLSRTLAASCSTTIWGVSGALLITEALPAVEPWMPATLFCLVTLALAYRLRGLRVFETPPGVRTHALAIALGAQGLALVPLIVALAIEQAWGEILAWALVGAGVAIASLRARMTITVFYGIALLGLGAFGTLDLVTAKDPLYTEGVARFGLFFTWWMALMGAHGALLLLVSWCVHRWKPASEPWRGLTNCCAIGAGCFFLLMVLHSEATGRGVLLAWALFGALCTALALRPKWRWSTVAGATYVAFASIAWGVYYVSSGWDTAEYARAPFLHEGLGWALVLSALWAVNIVRATPLSAHKLARDHVRVAWYGAGTLLMIATTLEISRVAQTLTTDETFRSGAVSVWWALVGIGTLIAGVVRRAPQARYTGLALLLIATGKLLTSDVAHLSDPVRVGCFLVLGLALLGVAAGYLRVGTKHWKRSPDEGHDASADDVGQRGGRA